MNDALPHALRAVLPGDAARSWVILRDLLPDGLVLDGGTAIAAHLHHRTSRDLDFFFANPALDLSAVRARLESARPFAARTHTRTASAGRGQSRLQSDTTG